MRTPIIAGNWKMHLTQPESEALVQQVKRSCGTAAGVEVVVCPPFTALAAVSRALGGSSIGLGAQNMHWDAQGAFTGEVSPTMLRDAGCRWVILGHSERRTLFDETDEAVRRKLLAALQHGLKPIVCIGETLAEREANRTFDVLTRQLEGGLKDVPSDRLIPGGVVFAYEPVWAIGTGRNATPEQAQEAHAFIRQWLAKHAGAAVADSLRLQYGGSVSAANAAALLQQPDVDGALVGGASLKAEAFSAIVKAALESKAVAK